MNVLITGVAGFIGSRVAQRFISEGHKVVMRLLLDESANIFYPNENMLRVSDGNWRNQTLIRVASSGNATGQEAINQVRGFVTDNYGANYLPEAPRVYKSKAKNAQEAHECIRPTNINLSPKEVEASVNNNNFGFMFAPGYHSAMKYVGPVRKKIGK